MLKGLKAVCSGAHCLVKLILEDADEMLCLEKGCSSSSCVTQRDDDTKAYEQRDEDLPFVFLPDVVSSSLGSVMVCVSLDQGVAPSEGVALLE